MSCCYICDGMLWHSDTEDANRDVFIDRNWSNRLIRGMRLVVLIQVSTDGWSFDRRLRRPVDPLTAAFGGPLILWSFGCRLRRPVDPLILWSFERNRHITIKNNNEAECRNVYWVQRQWLWAAVHSTEVQRLQNPRECRTTCESAGLVQYRLAVQSKLTTSCILEL